jgi:GTPase
VKALLFGDSSHGKSTLLGVLKTGERDDGAGIKYVIQARQGCRSSQANKNS